MDSRELQAFEGREVIAIKAKITKAGDGLSASLDADPIVMHTGEEGYLVLKYTVGPIRFVLSKDSDEAFVREQTYEAQTVTFVDDSMVEELIAQQEAINVRRAREKKGQFELPLPEFTDEGDE